MYKVIYWVYEYTCHGKGTTEHYQTFNNIEKALQFKRVLEYAINNENHDSYVIQWVHRLVEFYTPCGGYILDKNIRIIKIKTIEL